jgi:hypothetical protein
VFAQSVLIVWIFVSIALFALLSPLRAFLLTYLVGYLLLPVEMKNGTDSIGAIVISQSLQIDKLTACNLGALIGTLVFAPGRFSRFRWHWVDAVYGVILVGIFLSSAANGLGPKDGISHIIEEFRGYIPLIVLARIYITTASDLHESLRALVAAAFLYTFLAIAEWRFSPQAHRLVYGYFQHSFEQFERYSHFRPVGFLHHAIEFAFFMASTAAVAGWLWFRKQLQPLWGWIPGVVVVAALMVGLAVTMTFAGYGLWLLAMGMFAGFILLRSRWLLLILPLFSICWMVGRYTNQIDAHVMLNIAGSIDPSRSESLAYRLDAERIHFNLISSHLLLGKGAGNGFAFAEDGRILRALDAWWLLHLLFYGALGLGARMLLWSAGLIDSFRYWRRMTPDMRMLAIAVSVLLGVQFVDFLFNSFPSPFLLMLDMGLVATLQSCRETPLVYCPPMEWEESLPEAAAVS